jgi:hypothetical protein
LVIVITVLYGMIEDRGIRGKSRDRILPNVSAKRATGQELASDVVEPEALTDFLQLLRRFCHFFSIIISIATCHFLPELDGAGRAAQTVAATGTLKS